MLRPLTAYENRIRLPGETDQELLERLREQHRGRPQATDESDSAFRERLVRNAYMRGWMKSDAAKPTRSRRQETLRAERANGGAMALAERLRSKRKSARRAAMLRTLKEKPCMDCGGVFPTCVMDFDHRDPTSKHPRFKSPGMMAARTKLETFLAEIAKCDLVCANCHRIRTHIGRDDGSGRR